MEIFYGSRQTIGNIDSFLNAERDFCPLERNAIEGTVPLKSKQERRQASIRA